MVGELEGTFIVSDAGLYFVSFPAAALMHPVECVDVDLSLDVRIATDRAGSLAVLATPSGIYSLSCYV